MQFTQPHAFPLPIADDGLMQNKKRKICETSNYMDNNQENFMEDRNCNLQGRHFIFLRHVDNDSIFHTEEWQPSGSTLFSPLTEDLLINTRNIEQFSCSKGSVFVAGQDGSYSKTLTGDVLHLWRFCTQKRKLFISRSFFFRHSQDFFQVQQTLQRL